MGLRKVLWATALERFQGLLLRGGGDYSDDGAALRSSAFFPHQRVVFVDCFGAEAPLGRGFTVTCLGLSDSARSGHSTGVRALVAFLCGAAFSAPSKNIPSQDVFCCGGCRAQASRGLPCWLEDLPLSARDSWEACFAPSNTGRACGARGPPLSVSFPSVEMPSGQQVSPCAWFGADGGCFSPVRYFPRVVFQATWAPLLLTRQAPVLYNGYPPRKRH